MQFARINDVTIHYQIIGAPADKPVIVFVNSLGTDFRIWRDVVVRLGGRFRHRSLRQARPRPLRHRPDPLLDRGPCRRSRRAARPLSGRDRPSSAALSVGGLIAQSLYASRPDLVRALILCDTAHKIGTADSWNARIATVEAGWHRADRRRASWSAGSRPPSGVRATPTSPAIATC